MADLPNGIQRNGRFNQILVWVLTAGLATASGGLIKLYGEVQVLKADTNIGRRVDVIEILMKDIATDRDKRTVIIQQFKDTDAELKQAIIEIKLRLDHLERKR